MSRPPRAGPIDRIKIDRSFVQGIGGAPESEGITRAVIEIGHRLGMSVLAEGVETEAQAEALRSWGCDEAQGFLFGLPVEAPAAPLRGAGAGVPVGEARGREPMSALRAFQPSTTSTPRQKATRPATARAASFGSG